MSGGHIRQRSPGSWEIRYKSARRTFTKTIHGSKAAAQRALREIIVDHDKGIAASAPPRC